MVAFSYGAGLLGSLAYMRMLGNTVDSMADGAKGLVKYVFLYSLAATRGGCTLKLMGAMAHMKKN